MSIKIMQFNHLHTYGYEEMQENRKPSFMGLT